MGEDAFDLVEQALESGGAEAGFAFLATRFREERKYALLFETRLMQKRCELGLPLVHNGSLADVPEEVRPAYEKAFIAAAREAGEFFLADGDIPRAWSYFRALGETAPVAAALERVEPGEGLERIIEIAFHEGVHPRRGFELVLAHYDICRAISFFEQYPGRAGRDDCLRLLVRTLHGELVDRLQRTIAQAEGQAPETRSVPALIAGRDGLFEEHSYYVDTSHLVSVLRLSLELDDSESLALALEMSEYGQHLSPMYHYRGDPPFEDIYRDHAIYLRALLGQDVEGGIAHFRRKAAEADPEQTGSAPAQVLVGLLARLKRCQEALEVYLQYLPNADPAQLACPSLFQLCQMAGDYGQLMALARGQGDLLHFAAGALQNRRAAG